MVLRFWESKEKCRDHKSSFLSFPVSFTRLFIREPAMGADFFANPQNAVHRIIGILSGIIPRSDNQNLGKIVLNAVLPGSGQDNLLNIKG